jgi:hypothetical protein
MERVKLERVRSLVAMLEVLTRGVEGPMDQGNPDSPSPWGGVRLTLREIRKDLDDILESPELETLEELSPVPRQQTSLSGRIQRAPTSAIGTGYSTPREGRRPNAARPSSSLSGNSASVLNPSLTGKIRDLTMLSSEEINKLVENQTAETSPDDQQARTGEETSQHAI